MVAEDNSQVHLHLCPRIGSNATLLQADIQKDRSRLEAGRGWRNSREVHLSRFFPSPFILSTITACLDAW